jgi:hypothetical protein
MRFFIFIVIHVRATTTRDCEELGIPHGLIEACSSTKTLSIKSDKCQLFYKESSDSIKKLKERLIILSYPSLSGKPNFNIPLNCDLRPTEDSDISWFNIGTSVDYSEHEEFKLVCRDRFGLETGRYMSIEMGPDLNKYVASGRSYDRNKARNLCLSLKETKEYFISELFKDPSSSAASISSDTDRFSVDADEYSDSIESHQKHGDIENEVPVIENLADICTSKRDGRGAVEICTGKNPRLVVEGSQNENKCWFWFGAPEKQHIEKLEKYSRVVNQCGTPSYLKQNCLDKTEMKSGLIWNRIKVVSVERRDDSKGELTCTRGPTVMKYFVDDYSKDDEFKEIIVKDPKITKLGTIANALGLGDLYPIKSAGGFYYKQSKANVACRKLATAHRVFLDTSEAFDANKPQGICSN